MGAMESEYLLPFERGAHITTLNHRRLLQTHKYDEVRREFR